MSEYQFIHFQALDGPLTDEQLAFMQRQSTRAHVTRWEFTNEYHFGDFRGDVEAMMRNGYDVHLHFANFGIRRLMFRLPAGLPCDAKTFQAFQAEYGLEWHADQADAGGILEICPEGDADAYDHYFEDVDSVLDNIAPLRDALMAGDLRPLYLAWLACGGDDEAMEPPVPAGLGELVAEPEMESGAFPRNGPEGAAQERLLTPFRTALLAMADFYELSDNLLAAAAEQSPPLPERFGQADALGTWIAGQSKQSLQTLVLRLLDDHAAARAAGRARLANGRAGPHTGRLARGGRPGGAAAVATAEEGRGGGTPQAAGRDGERPGEDRRLGPPPGGRAVGQPLQASGAGVGRAARGARPGKGARLRAGRRPKTARR